ncbi:MAG TPA: TetR/AcrR family transcriptional regulator [Solirubrobacteraceae bacterium]
MSPQVSNREALLEGALRCIEQRGYGEITTRDIAAAANANVASIAYHFGSKDALIGEALAEGFRRWFAEFARDATKNGANELEGFSRGAMSTLRAGVGKHRGMAQAFVAALSRAPHDDGLREALARSYHDARAGLAAFLGLHERENADLNAGILIAVFDGLLIQWLIDPDQGKRDLAALPTVLDALLRALAQAPHTTK